MNSSATQRRDPWNKGKLTGQKAALRLLAIWAIRVRLQLGIKVREQALSSSPSTPSPAGRPAVITPPYVAGR